MTSNQFNEKYKFYLEKGHYGMGIDIPEIVIYFDKLFEDLVKIPGFQYKQIKSKFSYGRFYSTIGRTLTTLIENKLTELLKKY